MALMKTLAVLLALVAITHGFGFQFEDMFQQQDGGQGGEETNSGPEEVEKGYECPESFVIVDHPRQCPCPGHQMVKCKLDDWYACYPANMKCPEGKFSHQTASEEAEFDFDDEDDYSE
eukprot:m.25225 g.25225  ORF g.25225 m.25225 type:complete len:118 (+) comp13148_c0_seq1:67-420(+)